MESWDFLVGLGLPLEEWDLPKIHATQYYGPQWRILQQYFLWVVLVSAGINWMRPWQTLPEQEGVDLFENTKVYDIHFEEGIHRIESSAGLFTSTVACACYGKKSNLDVKWRRRFFLKQ